MVNHWTLEQDEDLRSCWLKVSSVKLARRYGRTVMATKQRACDLGITSRTNDGETGRAERREQDDNFIRAMISAIRAGRERPDRAGIDTRPGTRSPIFLTPEDAALAFHGRTA